MKSSVARYENGKTNLSFEAIDASLILPTARTYGKKESDPTSKKESIPAMANA